MQQLIQRTRLIEKIETGLREFPVTVLLGARQTGKTTLSRMIAGKRDHVTVFDLESPASRAGLSRTPELTLSDCKGLVIIDEVQRMPELFALLRPLCDSPGRKASFLLLGSASPDLVKGVSESLAGRACFIQVSGFAIDEVGAENQDRLWLHGSFPKAYTSNKEGAWRWLDSFSQTFLERDLPLLGVRIPAETLRRFWIMLSHYHGQIWNSAEIGQAMSVSSKTVLHYRDILSGSYMLRVLPPWFENIGKRQIKSHKVYLRDSGLLHSFMGIETMQGLRSHPKYGASWEGFAMEQVISIHGDRDIYFWGTQRGAELDLLIMRHGKRLGFEFKCRDAPSTTKSMHIAVEDLGLEHLWVIYPGKESYRLDKRITALPLSQLSKTTLREK
ncbi:MAG: ATP-binding protein [Victivallales bacterium]